MHILHTQHSDPERFLAVKNEANTANKCLQKDSDGIQWNWF